MKSVSRVLHELLLMRIEDCVKLTEDYKSKLFFYNVEISRILPTVETELSLMWLEFPQELITTISNIIHDKLSL